MTLALDLSDLGKARARACSRMRGQRGVQAEGGCWAQQQVVMPNSAESITAAQRLLPADAHADPHPQAASFVRPNVSADSMYAYGDALSVESDTTVPETDFQADPFGQVCCSFLHSHA